MEAAWSQRLAPLAGPLSTIAKQLGTTQTHTKDYVKSSDDFRGIDVRRVIAVKREAILVAVAGLPAEE